MYTNICMEYKQNIGLDNNLTCKFPSGTNDKNNNKWPLMILEEWWLYYHLNSRKHKCYCLAGASFSLGQPILSLRIDGRVASCTMVIHSYPTVLVSLSVNGEILCWSNLDDNHLPAKEICTITWSDLSSVTNQENSSLIDSPN